MDINKLADRARKSISSYCFKECKAYCCRKSYLIINNKQADLVTQKHRAKLEQNKILIKISQDKYSLYIGNYGFPCPSLTKDFKCSIHNKRDRPDTCKQFPIFIEKDTIKLSHRCPAVREDKFYPFIHRWKIAGYKVIVSDPLADSEFYKLNHNISCQEPHVSSQLS